MIVIFLILLPYLSVETGQNIDQMKNERPPPTILCISSIPAENWPFQYFHNRFPSVISAYLLSGRQGSRTRVFQISARKFRKGSFHCDIFRLQNLFIYFESFSKPNSSSTPSVTYSKHSLYVQSHLKHGPASPCQLFT